MQYRSDTDQIGKVRVTDRLIILSRENKSGKNLHTLSESLSTITPQKERQNTKTCLTGIRCKLHEELRST